jgi:hypothetical protein
MPRVQVSRAPLSRTLLPGDFHGVDDPERPLREHSAGDRGCITKSGDPAITDASLTSGGIVLIVDNAEAEFDDVGVMTP